MRVKTKAELKAEALARKESKLKKSMSPLRKSQKRKYTKLENKTAAQLVKVADEWFSKYVRIRDSKRTGDVWHGTCITCTKTGPIALLEGDKLRFLPGWDAGHFIGRGTKILRYEEENVNLQCSFRCNRMRSGEHEKYKDQLDIKYGHGTYRKLERIAEEDRKAKMFKFNKPYLMQVINDSKECLRHYAENS